ncbi:hypothetical protein Hdeb2414_s0102g00794251 [Helianthus debilis subsp. tardiflorus]
MVSQQRPRREKENRWWWRSAAVGDSDRRSLSRSNVYSVGRRWFRFKVIWLLQFHARFGFRCYGSVSNSHQVRFEVRVISVKPSRPGQHAVKCGQRQSTAVRFGFGAGFGVRVRFRVNSGDSVT